MLPLFRLLQDVNPVIKLSLLIFSSTLCFITTISTARAKHFLDRCVPSHASSLILLSTAHTPTSILAQILPKEIKTIEWQHYSNQPKYPILLYLQVRLHLLQQGCLCLHCFTGSDPQTIYMGLSKENVEYQTKEQFQIAISHFTGEFIYNLLMDKRISILQSVPFSLHPVISRHSIPNVLTLYADGNQTQPGRKPQDGKRSLPAPPPPPDLYQFPHNILN